MTTPKAQTRLYQHVRKHVEIYREVTRKDFNKLVYQAGVRVNERDTVTCGRCGRKVHEPYTVAGVDYGKKCALIVRQTLVDEGVFV